MHVVNHDKRKKMDDSKVQVQQGCLSSAQAGPLSTGFPPLACFSLLDHSFKRQYLWGIREGTERERKREGEGGGEGGEEHSEFF